MALDRRRPGGVRKTEARKTRFCRRNRGRNHSAERQCARGRAEARAMRAAAVTGVSVRHLTCTGHATGCVAAGNRKRSRIGECGTLPAKSQQQEPDNDTTTLHESECTAAAPWAGSRTGTCSLLIGVTAHTDSKDSSGRRLTTVGRKR